MLICYINTTFTEKKEESITCYYDIHVILLRFAFLRNMTVIGVIWGNFVIEPDYLT